MKRGVLSLLPLVFVMGCITGGMVVNSGDRISIEYEAHVLNQSFDKGLITFIVSDHGVIPGIEAGVIGMGVGEEKTFTIPPALGYGEYDESLLVPISTSIFNDSVPNLYDKVALSGQEGMVVNVSDDWIIIDLNHWLAGQELVFDVKVLTIERL